MVVQPRLCFDEGAGGMEITVALEPDDAALMQSVGGAVS
jgi:hypothetical protein